MMADDEDDVNLSYSAQQINELLRCPICWDRFRNPKLLPCQHTFCESPCLEQLVDRFHRIKCPECRIEHRVPYAGVSAFPNNRTLLNFLDLSAQTSPLLPPPTANQNQPIIPPINNPTNQGQGINNSHNAPPQAVPSNPPGNETQRSGCWVCSRHIPLSRCAHCDHVICDTCKRSHMDQLRLDVNRLVSQLRRGMPSFSQAISVIEGKSESLHQRAEAGKAEITETIERYISELRNRQRLLHSEVQMWLLGEIRSLRMCQENVEVELASTASFCDSTESVLSRPNQVIPDQDLVDMKRNCVEHIEIMRAYEDGTGVRLPRERQVQVQFEGNRFSQAISNFGDLVVVEGPEPPVPTRQPRGSSSRESSPRVPAGATAHTGAAAPTRLPPSGNQSVNNSTLDRALAAIGSSLPGSQSPRVAARRGERMAGLMGGGGGGVGGGSTESSDSSSNRPSPVRQVRGARQQPASTPRQPAGRQPTTQDTDSGPSSIDDVDNIPRPVQNLSWELPLDLAYPPRRNMRAGNVASNPSNRANRRSLQERRRHNLSDSSLPDRRGNSQNETRTPRQQNQPRLSVASNSEEPVASTSSVDPSRPTLQRSRTYTREDFAPIREEENVSRASSAGPSNRARSPVRFDIDLNGVEMLGGRTGEVGGESVRVNVATNNYQDKGRAIIRFGVRGSDNREFVWPRGVAVSRSDQIYIADSSNHRVQVFDNIGSFVKCFGSYGQSDAEFDCLAGVAINTMGDILITDRYNHRVQVFDHQLNFKLRFGEEGQGDGQLNYPWGIATDSMGFIYVCDKENHRVQVFQSNGIFARKFGSLGRRPGCFENPHYLAISPDNKVYVSDSSNHRIQVFTMYGDFLFTFGSIGTMQGQMKYPKGISIDDQGFVVVADSGNNRIQVFRGDGRFYCMFGGYGSDSGQFKGLEGLDLLSNGNVVVSDRENHRIQIF